MERWYNASGRPFSSLQWLEAHHRAKLPERLAFAKSILASSPRRIVDLGCGPGLWLEAIHYSAPRDCELVGVDSCEKTLHQAKERAQAWDRRTEFIHYDIGDNRSEFPEADLFLAFNIFPYLNSPEDLLACLHKRLRSRGEVVVRQYDGTMIRFGPMEQSLRFAVDANLQTSVGPSSQFHHYDLDRVYSALRSSPFEACTIEFELFQRSTPFPAEFLDYFEKTVRWTLDKLSEDTRARLQAWAEGHAAQPATEPSYFVEVDLVARLS